VGNSGTSPGSRMNPRGQSTARGRRLDPPGGAAPRAQYEATSRTSMVYTEPEAAAVRRQRRPRSAGPPCCPKCQEETDTTPTPSQGIADADVDVERLTGAYAWGPRRVECCTGHLDIRARVPLRRAAAKSSAVPHLSTRYTWPTAQGAARPRSMLGRTVVRGFPARSRSRMKRSGPGPRVPGGRRARRRTFGVRGGRAARLDHRIRWWAPD